jgi:hypothetical protein
MYDIFDIMYDLIDDIPLIYMISHMISYKTHRHKVDLVMPVALSWAS